MRLYEFTTESPVQSSWQADLSYDRANGDIIMVTNKNMRYRIHQVPFNVYRNWRRSPSKGKYWHKFVKNNYQIDRIL